MTFTARFARDLKASGPKTAVLGVLVLVGLYFWVPPIWRAVAGSGTPTPTASTPASAATTPAPPSTTPTTPTAPKAIAWQDAERLREQDDLFRPAGPTDLNGDAFTFRDDFLPIDVEFAEFHEEPARAVARSDAAPSKSTKTKAMDTAEPATPDAPPLTLQSTLVGSGRRVAVINSRVYAEGATVAAGGKVWTVLNVEPRRVLLDGGGRTFELTIDPFATAQARQ